MKIVECIPNISEGRRQEVIEAVVEEVRKIQNVQLLDVEPDKDHNRTVITFIGDPEACAEAAFNLAKKAAELIDLNQHRGEHPRIGATDVIPFVPIMGVTMEECVALAEKLGMRIAEELQIPVYLYEEAAKKPERKDLAVIRKGEFEGLKEEIKKDPKRAPDFGKPELHPTAGATVVGARVPLIAFNVNLNSTDVEIAKKIAKGIRFKNGGYRYVKAMGFDIKEKGYVQVSMNLTNYQGTPIFRVFETIKSEAERYGTSIRGSEIIGLVPMDALIDCAEYYLRLADFKRTQILENRIFGLKEEKLMEMRCSGFISELGSESPAPGGGSASAFSCAMGAALVGMVARLTVKKKKYADVREQVEEIMKKADWLRNEFVKLVDRDTEAFNEVMKAVKMPEDKPEEKEAKDKAYEEALKTAVAVPLTTMKLGIEVLELAKSVATIGNRNAISDAGCAARMVCAGVRGAYYNVLANLKDIKDAGFRTRTLGECQAILDRMNLMHEIEEMVVKELLGNAETQ
ncbi:MAG: glutamate formimidoyltransferase [Thermoplasmata archaeon]|nr:glutamate formimidoyltransferase [Thermoplasmata archaeon]